MVPKVGDIVYFIYYGKVCIFEILKIQYVNNELSPDTYRFTVCVLVGDWPFDYIFVSRFKLGLGDHIVEIEDGEIYMIFDEETFVNYVTTHEITEDW